MVLAPELLSLVALTERIEAGQSRHGLLAKEGCAVSEVAKGFRQRRFCDLSDRDKRGAL